MEFTNPPSEVRAFIDVVGSSLSMEFTNPSIKGRKRKRECKAPLIYTINEEEEFNKLGDPQGQGVGFFCVGN